MCSKEEIKEIINRNKTCNSIQYRNDLNNFLFKESDIHPINISKFNARISDCIRYEDIDEDIYKVNIGGCNDDYISKEGNVYLYYGDNLFYKRSIYINKHNKYEYVAIRINGKNKSRRLHVLLAKTFIKNEYPNLLKIVGHKDNVKANNKLENLYWTNNQENTQSAVDDGLNNSKVAEENESSIKIKVLDKNTLKIVGVYGSIRECGRCVENISETMISKMARKNNIYKPRSKNFIYMKATDDEFEANICVKNKKLTESLPVDKSPKVFILCNDSLGYREKFDNQTKASLICGIKQSTLSHMIKSGQVVNGWHCIYKDSIPYKEASSYKNMISKQDLLIVENIFTKEKKEFDTVKELRDELGLVGHDIRHYLNTGQLIMNEWKLLEMVDKEKYALYAA